MCQATTKRWRSHSEHPRVAACDDNCYMCYKETYLRGFPGANQRAVQGQRGIQVEGTTYDKEGPDQVEKPQGQFGV